MKKYRLLTNGGYSSFNIGEVYELHSYSEGGVRLKIPYTGKVLYFYDSEVEEVVNEKPERYASREVHGMDVLDLINHWNLNFSEGNILKYLLRDKGEDISDFKKISDYANREVKRLESCK